MTIRLFHGRRVREIKSEIHFFFFNDTATTEIYTLSLHDALPICRIGGVNVFGGGLALYDDHGRHTADRKSTRLNSSHLVISYAVFCLKKKKNHRHLTQRQPDNQRYIRHIQYRSKRQPTLTHHATL